MDKFNSLVDAAGAAIGYGRNPFETPVGAKIDEATDDILACENWMLYMEICDIINATDEGPRDAVRAIRRKLENSVGKSNTSTIYTLTLLETCAKNCSKAFHVLICRRDFVNDVLIDKVISSKVEPPLMIQEKVLQLIQSWAHAFSPDPDLGEVAEIYMELKRKGVDFPNPTDEDLLLVKTNETKEPKSHEVVKKDPDLVKKEKTVPRDPDLAERVAKGRKLQAAKLTASGRLTEGQVRKLQRDIEVTIRNNSVFSELLTDLQIGEKHPEDEKLLLEISKTCADMQERILELIGIVHHRSLTAQLLEINDDMNNLFLRYERYLNNTETELKKGDVIGVLSPSSVHLEVDAAADGSAAASGLSNPAEFEEIEAWMKEHDPESARKIENEANDNQADGITQEFDRFLEKRAEAVKDMN